MERKLISMVVLSGHIGEPIKHKEPWQQPELKELIEQAKADVLRMLNQEDNK